MDSHLTPADSQINVHVAKRMEWSRGVETYTLLTDPEGWMRTAKALLQPTSIHKDHGRHLKNKRTGAVTPLRQKHCSPGILPYLLPGGMARGTAAATRARWVMVPFDLDAVGLTVTEVIDIANRGFAGLRRLIWTTWSSEDGYASVRVMLPFSDTAATQVDVGLAWWWGRAKLIEAGLPLDSVKSGEPACDPRVNDGRLFFLPAYPASKLQGEGKWGGGTLARGCGEPTDRFLSLSAIRGDAQAIAGAGESAHLTRWPKVPVPHLGRSHSRPGHGKVTTSRGNGNGSPANHTKVDFGAILHPTAGVSLLEWSLVNVSPGCEYSPIGNPWQTSARPNGETYLDGTSCVLHVSSDGTPWLHSFKENHSYRHQWDQDSLPQGVIDAAALTAPESVEAPLSPRAQVGVMLSSFWAREEAIRDGEAQYKAKLVNRKDKAVKIREGQRVAILKAVHGVELAESLLPTFRGHFGAMGLTKVGCRFRQGLYNPTTNETVVVTRRCRSIDCPSCAPAVAALKVAAILQWAQGRALFAHEFPAAKLENAVVALGRAVTKKTVGKTALEGEETKSGFTDSFPQGGQYVVFHSVTGQCVMLTDVEVPVAARGPKSPLGLPVASLRGRDTTRDYVVARAKQTYTRGQKRTDDGIQAELDGLPLTSQMHEVITQGRITSSRGIHLDPESILKSACIHTWFLEATDVDPLKYTELNQEAGRVVGDRNCDGSSLQAPAPLTAEERKAMWAGSAKDRAAKVMMPPQVERPDLSDPPSTPDFNALMDETLALAAPVESHAEPAATSMELTAMEVQRVQEVPTAATTDARNDHYDASPNAAPARATTPTAASAVMVAPGPANTLGEALVPRPVPPMTNWEALEAML